MKAGLAWWPVVAASFATTAALIPVIISLSLRRGFVDRPGELKVHMRPIPVFGGLGIFAGVVVATLVATLHTGGTGAIAEVLLVATALIALGVWDDLKNVPPRVRLVGQFLVAGATIALGYRIGAFPVAAIAIPLTTVFIAGVINTVNLFDGLDGLAGGTVSISLIGFAVVLSSVGLGAWLPLALGLLGALLGFLIYNFNPARIFMGDNGSTFLGYALAVLALNVAGGPRDLRSFVVALLLIGLPLVDTLVAIVRRAARGRPIFQGDRSHIYDQLVDHGLTVKQTALVCYAVQAGLVASAVALHATRG